MNVSACMKRNVISISEDALVEQAMRIVVRHHIGTLPVVNADRRLVGLVRLQNLLSLAMPDFVSLLDSISFVHSFGAVEDRKPSPQDMALNVRKVMIEPVSCDIHCSLLHAAAIMHRNSMADLPVVDDDGRLAGIASRVDIGTYLIRSWGITGTETDLPSV